VSVTTIARAQSPWQNCVDLSGSAWRYRHVGGETAPSMIEVELVGVDVHVGTTERGEHTEVRREPGGEADRGLRVLPRGERSLEVGVDRPGPHDEARRPRAGAPARDRGLRGRDDVGVLGEAEVVVRR
jgi:hypothetical protein